MQQARLRSKRAMSAAQENRAHTFQLAFTLTMAGVVFCAAGIAGYDFGKRALLLTEDRWTEVAADETHTPTIIHR